MSNGVCEEPAATAAGSCFEDVVLPHLDTAHRLARWLIQNDHDAEDAVQEAVLRAFRYFETFAGGNGRAWFLQIVRNTCYSWHRRSVDTLTDPFDEERHEMSPQPDPEHQAYAQELHRVLEEAVDGLPEIYRAVFMLRDIEGLSTSETGEGLGLAEEAVKTRLHRARAMIRRAVSARIGGQAGFAFQFQAPRCDRVVNAVLDHLSRC